ncbi:MAG: hypothetical protein J5564_04630 [Clostridia bacterium]|nr:hypothetical protein [Clostridia bacterium]
MMKMIGMILAAMLALSCLCGAAAAEALPGSGMTGEIADGNYVIRIPLDPDDAAVWTADDPQWEDAAVKLADTRTEDGMLVITYAPAAEGQTTVYIRHMDDGVCDRMYGFDLSAGPDGITEVTGGSFTASPDPQDLDPYVTGEWLQAETQFTVMDITGNGRGWDAEITSPMTHEAYVLRATLRYDCDLDCLVYSDGRLYDLPETETPAKTGLCGRMELLSTEDELQLAWISWDGEGDDREIVFEHEPALPACTYTGNDPIEKAIVDHMLGSGAAEMYLREAGDAAIPAPVILKTEMQDEDHATVYGNFWIMNYARRGSVLLCISGGEDPAVLTLEK